MASKRGRPIAYRVSEIDQKVTAERLHAAIKLELTDDEKDTKIRLKQFTPGCCDEGKTQTTIATFQPGPPEFLNSPEGDPKEGYCLEVDDSYVYLDRVFDGLTQLYPTAPGEKIALDVIAITGINGHAYGSWAGSTMPYNMWLQDFLSVDLQNCRTMLYGYNSDLNIDGSWTTRAYCDELMEEIIKSRCTAEEKRRPIVFIGHSFGGILVAQSIAKAHASTKPELRSIYDSTYATVFFGVPHRGIFMDDVLEMVQKRNFTGRETLIKQIIARSNSTYSEDLERFIDITPQFKVLTLYEMLKTPTVKKEEGPSDKFGATGDPVERIKEQNAWLQLPANAETKIPVNASHSDMAKFIRQSNQTYRSVLMRLKSYANDAKGGLETRSVSEGDDRELQEVSKANNLLPVTNKETATAATGAAANIGRSRAVKAGIHHGANVNSRYRNSESDWETCLARAARNGHLDVVKIILAEKADPNIGTGSRDSDKPSEDVEYDPPLLEAAAGGHIEVVRALLNWEANVNIKNNPWEYTALHFAAQKGNSDLATLLLERGALVDARAKLTKMTPLHEAASKGYANVVKVLLNNGANPNACGRRGRTAMHEAAENGHIKTVELLSRYGASHSARDRNNETPLDRAIKRGHDLLAWWLVNQASSKK